MKEINSCENNGSENYSPMVCLQNRNKINKDIENLEHNIEKLLEATKKIGHIEKYFNKIEKLEYQIGQLNKNMVDYVDKVSYFDNKLEEKFEKVDYKINKNENEFVKLNAERRMEKWFISGFSVVVFSFLSWLAISVIDHSNKIAAGEQKFKDLKEHNKIIKK